MNALRWDGRPGHYEVYYLTLNDAASGWGAWIRYTMLAPHDGDATCALWFVASGDGRTLAYKQSFPIAEFAARDAPFELWLGGAQLTDEGMRGACGDAAWELSFSSRVPGVTHVHPLLEPIASTVLALPHPDLEVAGTLTLEGRELVLQRARGGQAHLWGSKHANRWAWAHCNAFDDAGSYLDGVSVFLSRAGHEVGPSTPVVGRLLGNDFRSIAPLRVIANRSLFGHTTWHLEARQRARRITVQTDAPVDSLVGVTYEDPNGEPVHCYNSQLASMRVSIWDRGRGGWMLRDTLVGDAHFEYAQRTPLADLAVRI